MKVNYRIVPCEGHHIDRFAATMPQIERDEIAAWTDLDRQTVMRWEWQRSLQSWCLLVDETPIAAWGVIGSLLDAEWLAWLVSAETISQFHPISVVRTARRELKRLAAGHVLQGLCPKFHKQGVRFLELLGFHQAGSIDAPNGESCAIVRYEPE